jgi:hypothetical protein
MMISSVMQTDFKVSVMKTQRHQLMTQGGAMGSKVRVIDLLRKKKMAGMN